MKKQLIFLCCASSVLVSSCGGPKAFTKGEYDDPTRVELLDDKFNEADMQLMSNTIIKAMEECPSVAKMAKAPYVITGKIQNRTQEHIDLTAMTEMIQTALINSSKFNFINAAERSAVEEEYNYHKSGAVDPKSQKKRGKQIAPDYLLSGALATNIQQVGENKFIYYKLTMNLTNLETTAIACTQEKQVRKKYKKRSI